MMTFETSSAHFLQEMEMVKNCSPHTIRNYNIDLNAFKSFLLGCLKNSIDLSTIDRKAVRAFLAECYIQNQTKRTIARKVSTLRSFFKFAMAKKWITANPMEDLETPKLEKKIPPTISYAQVKTLLEQPDTTTLFGLRDRTMMELFYSSGLRVSELVGLNRLDFDSAELLIRIRGKGKKERIVPVTKSAGDWLLRYLNASERFEEVDGHAKECDHEAIFLNKHGERLTVRSVDRHFQSYLKASGLALHITPHSIRHAIATHWLENGMDMKTIQMLLGHSCLATTTIYAQVSKTLKKKVYDQAHPRAKLRLL